MNFNLNDRTIFLTLSGSHAYGFATSQSDFDYRGISIAPLDSYLGLEPRFEQIVDDKNKTVWKHFPAGLVEPEADMQVMELIKFCRLAAQCNPSVIENLFSPEDCIIRQDLVMKELLENKNCFLSRQAKARFCGYALSQLNRVKRHRQWLQHPIEKEPFRSDFGLPDYKIISSDQLGAAKALIEEQVKEFSINQDDLPEHVKIELENTMSRILKTIWQTLGSDKDFPIGYQKSYQRTEDVLFESMLIKCNFDENFIELLRREKQYKTSKNNWNSYQKWLADRNPARAELEKKFGYDSKHAVHLVRLIRMCREILETGQVLVKRPDAEEIKAIRAGAWTYEKICEFAETEDKALQIVASKSKLPNAPDMKKIHEMVFGMVMRYNFNKCDVLSEEKLAIMVQSLLVEPKVQYEE